MSNQPTQRRVLSSEINKPTTGEPQFIPLPAGSGRPISCIPRCARLCRYACWLASAQWLPPRALASFHCVGFTSTGICGAICQGPMSCQLEALLLCQDRRPRRSWVTKLNDPPSHLTPWPLRHCAQWLSNKSEPTWERDTEAGSASTNLWSWQCLSILEPHLVCNIVSHNPLNSRIYIFM